MNSRNPTEIYNTISAMESRQQSSLQPPATSEIFYLVVLGTAATQDMKDDNDMWMSMFKLFS